MEVEKKVVTRIISRNKVATGSYITIKALTEFDPRYFNPGDDCKIGVIVLSKDKKQIDCMCCYLKADINGSIIVDNLYPGTLCDLVLYYNLIWVEYIEKEKIEMMFPVTFDGKDALEL